MRSRALKPAAIAISFAVIGALAGCGTPSSGGSTSGGASFVDSTRLSLKSPNFDGVVGQTLVIPVNYAPSEPLDGTSPAARARLLLDDGTVIPAGLYRVDVSPSTGQAAWLPPAGAWRVTGVHEIAGSSVGPSTRSTWVLVADLPATERPARLRLGTDSLAVRWLESDAPSRPVSRSIVPDARVSGVPRASILAPEFESPMRRWRGWLATRSARLGPSEDSQKFTDPVIEALAAQEEGRWSFALARFAREDRSMCDRLVTALSATADFGSGHILPVWSTSEADAAELLSALLEPNQEPAARKERVTEWLAAQISTIAWVQDDAGQSEEGSGKQAGVLGILNLGERREIARIDVGDRRQDASEPVVLEPGVARRVRVLSDDSSADAARRSVPVRVRVGSKGWTLGAMLREVAADPPGLFLSPFFEDATLESWRAGEMRPAQGDGLDAAAMLFRSVKGEWVVHVEVAESEEGGRTKPLVNPGPSLESVSDGSRVRIWLGPVGAERQIEIRRGGVVTGRDAQGRSFMPTCDIGRSPGTWSAAVTVPRESIESGGLLRIGIECFRADGGRCAFPRPMVPWQDSPGRVAVQTADW